MLRRHCSPVVRSILRSGRFPRTRSLQQRVRLVAKCNVACECCTGSVGPASLNPPGGSLIYSLILFIFFLEDGI